MGVVGLYPGDAGGGTCACDDAPPLMLEASLTVPSVGCIVCYQPVPLGGFGLDDRLTMELLLWEMEIAGWRLRVTFGRKAGGTGESEGWHGMRKVQNLASEYNVRGFDIVRRLSRLRRTYYAVSQDVAREDFRPLRAYPRCRKQLAPRYGLKCCDPCRIVITDECTPDYHDHGA